MMVIAMASTPSLKASSLFLLIPRVYGMAPASYDSKLAGAAFGRISWLGAAALLALCETASAYGSTITR